MCLAPVRIKNPHKYKGNQFASEKGKGVQLPKYLLPSTDYITVPCGKCSECRDTYYNSILQRAIIESFSSYIYFITLTYDNEHIPSIELEGEKFLYANYDHIQGMFKRFRNLDNIDGREFRYLSVNEYGDRNHRPHFHLLLFVSKLENDNEQTPHYLRDTIFNTLGNCFAVNKGTRKNPKYEKLFTYRMKYKNGKLNTNYFVKYVEPNEFQKMCDINCIQDSSYVKTVRYLIGYVNKPSKYEQKLDCVINSYKEDSFTYLKLRHLLKSQVRYSKGFGCGFQNGKKYYMEKISVRCSNNVLVYSELVDSLPDSYEEFVDCYGDLADDFIEFKEKNYYKKYTNWQKCINSMSSHEYLLHCINLKYFKKEFSDIYKSFNDTVKPTVSYGFNFIHRDYTYDMQKVRTVEPEDSPIFKYLRQGVEEGIKSGVPYLAFKMVGSKGFTALCKYYKDRVCTIEDTIRLFDRLGVKNYEEWLDLFNKQRSNKDAISKGNIHKYYNDDIVEDNEIKNTLTGQEKLNYLFS